METLASPSSCLSKKAQRICQPATFYWKHATGHFKQTWTLQATGHFKQTWTLQADLDTSSRPGHFKQTWTLQADLDKKMQFPDIVQTSLRPDIVIQLNATKRLVIVELTVPWDERCQSAYELKTAKYTDLQTV